jgi:hypothetical protein
MRSYARWLFGTAAVLNIAVGSGLLFLRPWLGPLLRLDPIGGTNLVLANLAGALVLVFGAAYACAAADPAKYRSYIQLGAIGKPLAVAAVVWPWLAGAVSWTLPALALADVAYALLFCDFLRRSRVS